MTVLLCSHTIEVCHMVLSLHTLLRLFTYGCHLIWHRGSVNCIKTCLIPSDICRTVNGLLKTALGPPPGSATTLSPAHDLTFRLESVKCLVRIIKSMGTWMDQQLKIGDFCLPNTSDNENLSENQTSRGGDEGNLPEFELQSEAFSELSNAATLEQRRAYKLELQV